MPIAQLLAVYFIATMLMVAIPCLLVIDDWGLREIVGMSLVVMFRVALFGYALTVKPLQAGSSPREAAWVGSLAAVVDFGVLCIGVALAYALHRLAPSALPGSGVTVTDKVAVGIMVLGGILVVSPWAVPLLRRDRSA